MKMKYLPLKSRRRVAIPRHSSAVSFDSTVSKVYGLPMGAIPPGGESSPDADEQECHIMFNAMKDFVVLGARNFFKP
ncbi:MAG: hypothetical protein V3571_05925 [Pseudodesulfovibrio sp.]